ncbi:NRT1/ PTR FAMILY 4.4 [Thalictrum thalictroides]|uniref:NRT1/ PTR FAMILY 4.4 n=1 Tax=Thalictrum thalictroides TaxID=46969 RepID=A0A7J6VVB9_THATH|nr:NRT1/ PTR FAMILY 4.4 [Thalictrum thalictroides]
MHFQGYTLMIIQSHYKKLQPDPCNDSRCVKGGQALMFYTAIGLFGLGAGAIRGCVPALGADQYDQKNPKEQMQLSRFFNWYSLCTTLGGTIGITIVVWVSMHKGWDKSFIISLSCTLVGLIIIALGKPLFRVRIPGDSPILRILQVLVVSVKNIKEKLPEDSSELYENYDQESISNEEHLLHTDQFRLLDKAAIIPAGYKPAKWRVCTVTQVEEVKIITRMMPIVLSTIFVNTCLAQLQTLTVQQGTLMNNHIGSFKVPTTSIPVIPLIFMSILLPIYEFAFVPAARKLTGLPNGITQLQRVGIGLVLSSISMSIGGIIEVKRKHEILHHGKRLNLFWLSFQYAVFGIADMFTLTGLIDFFYSEAPAGMRSMSTSFAYLSWSMGCFLSTALVNATNSVTSKISDSKIGWLEGRDMNKNHVERFYWFLAILSVLNFINYLYWANWYTYKKDVPIISNEQNSLKARSDHTDETESDKTATPN